jgi:hypothetical protein
MTPADREAMQDCDPAIVQRAWKWWAELPPHQKSQCSIWMLLALFASAEQKREK